MPNFRGVIHVEIRCKPDECTKGKDVIHIDACRSRPDPVLQTTVAHELRLRLMARPEESVKFPNLVLVLR